jgi:hypothetical protein
VRVVVAQVGRPQLALDPEVDEDEVGVGPSCRIDHASGAEDELLPGRDDPAVADGDVERLAAADEELDLGHRHSLPWERARGGIV